MAIIDVAQDDPLSVQVGLEERAACCSRPARGPPGQSSPASSRATTAFAHSVGLATVVSTTKS
jgi:hypothetical protein